MQSDPFKVLRLEPRFDLDLGLLETRHRELSRVLHPDRHVGRPSAERRQALSSAIEVNDALRVLKDPVRRAEVLLTLRGVDVDPERSAPATPEFLMQVLEEREELAAAEGAREVSRVRTLRSGFEARQIAVEAALARAFDDWSAASDAPASERVALITEKLAELRYLNRLIVEARAIEDELS